MIGPYTRVAFKTNRTTLPIATGPQTFQETVSFGHKVTTAGVALSGFKVDYTIGDREFNLTQVDVTLLSVIGDEVNYTVTAWIADTHGITKPGEHHFSGYIDVTITAEVYAKPFPFSLWP